MGSFYFDSFYKINNPRKEFILEEAAEKLDYYLLNYSQKKILPPGFELPDPNCTFLLSRATGN